jgi:glycosyltransferase involved in cell wall biosynthesis
MRMLLFNLATDMDDPILGFTTRWVWAMAQRVEHIDVMTMRAGRVEMPDNVQVYSVGKEKGYSEIYRTVEFYRQLGRIVRNDRIDVCFSHMIPIFTVLGAPLLKRKGIPIVTWYAHPSLSWVLKLAHHLSDRMVASLATAYPYKQDKLTVVGQGIDTDLFCPDGNMVQEDPPMVLYVGRLSPVKDLSTLLRANWLLRQRGRLVRVVVLGDPGGPQDEGYVRSLHAQVKELELEETVSFQSSVPMTGLPSWYRRCTVYVNLTPIGSGDKVAWEAMACGKPCLVANKGFNETLGEYAELLLFRYGDAEDLARRLEGLLSLSDDKRACMGTYLRQQVLRMHSQQRLADRLVQVFQEVQRCPDNKTQPFV